MAVSNAERAAGGIAAYLNRLAAAAAVAVLVMAALFGIALGRYEAASETGRLALTWRLETAQTLRGFNEVMLTEGSADSVALALANLRAATGSLERLRLRHPEFFAGSRLRGDWETLVAEMQPFLVVNNPALHDDRMLARYGRQMWRLDSMLQEVAAIEARLQQQVAGELALLYRALAVLATLAALCVLLAFRRLARRIAAPLRHADAILQGIGQQRDSALADRIGTALRAIESFRQAYGGSRGLQEIDRLMRTTHCLLGMLGREMRRSLRYGRLMRRRSDHFAHVAAHDPLTGLGNRAAFNAVLARAVGAAGASASRLAVLFVDLDQFKEVNDRLGHAVGDQVLVEAARRLSRCLRADDALARLGGDEFAFVMPAVVAEASVEQVAGRVVAAMREAFEVDDQRLHLGCSVGIAFYPEHGISPEELTRNADAAMYAAKAAGRACYRSYDLPLGQRVARRGTLEGRLHEALANGSLHLVYQPQYQAGDHARPSGVEALLRWQDPELGPVSPADFIPLAEANGLIVDIGRWVATAACRQLTAWRAAGIEVASVAINASAVQLQRADFADFVLATVYDCGLFPQDIEVEVTESVLASDGGATAANLAALSDAGVRIAIDDFGTGYSTLAYLRRFHVDRLKIDRSLVSAIDGDRVNHAIVDGLIGIAGALGCEVVCEGVERVEELATLRGLGCHFVQGFLLARPLAPEAVGPLFTEPAASPAGLALLAAPGAAWS